MSMFSGDLKGRDGRPPRVLILTRISTKNQFKASLEDQEYAVRRYIELRGWKLEDIEYEVIPEQDSAQVEDRPVMERLRREVNSGRWDYLIASDTDRIARGDELVEICKVALDAGCHVIGIGKGFTTEADNWKLLATVYGLVGGMEAESACYRVRVAEEAAFLRGGMLTQIPLGYVKRKVEEDGNRETSHQRHVEKAPYADAMFAGWYQMLMYEDATFRDVVAWTNREYGLGTNEQQVKRLAYNPILSGRRPWGRTRVKRRRQDRRPIVERRPESEWQWTEAAHLAVWTREQQEALIARLNRKNARHRRDRGAGDPLRGRRGAQLSPWPALAARCGLCGRIYRQGGHGRPDHLMCAGRYHDLCPNGRTFGRELFRRNVLRTALGAILELPDAHRRLFEQALLDRENLRSRILERRPELERRRAEAKKVVERVKGFLKNPDLDPAFVAQAANEARGDLAEIEHEIRMLESQAAAIEDLPGLDELLDLVRNMDIDELEFTETHTNALLRRVIQNVRVFPFGLCTGGHKILRAAFDVHPLQLLDPQAAGSIPENVDRGLVLHLTCDIADFPQKVTMIPDFLRLRSEGLNQYQIADRLGTSQPQVQHVAKLVRRMEELGIDDPYVPILFEDDVKRPLRPIEGWTPWDGSWPPNPQDLPAGRAAEEEEQGEEGDETEERSC